MPMPRKSFKTVPRILQQETGVLAGLAAQVERDHALVATVRAALPADLAPHCSGVAVHGQTLVVFTPSANWATRLRFHLPDVLRALARQHQVVCGQAVCRVMLTDPALADTAGGLPPAAWRRDISDASRSHIATAADFIADPDLAAALRRLATRK